MTLSQVMRYWIVALVLIAAVGSANADLVPPPLPAGFAPPISDGNVFAQDNELRTATRDLSGSWTWHRLNASAQQAAPASAMYVNSIRGTLFSWTHYWQTVPPPDGTVADLPQNPYHPPEGQPQPDPNSGLPDPNAGRIPSPSATILGMMGLVMIHMTRRRI